MEQRLGTGESATGCGRRAAQCSFRRHVPALPSCQSATQLPLPHISAKDQPALEITLSRIKTTCCTHKAGRASFAASGLAAPAPPEVPAGPPCSGPPAPACRCCCCPLRAAAASSCCSWSVAVRRTADGTCALSRCSAAADATSATTAAAVPITAGPSSGAESAAMACTAPERICCSAASRACCSTCGSASRRGKGWMNVGGIDS